MRFPGLAFLLICAAWAASAEAKGCADIRDGWCVERGAFALAILGEMTPTTDDLTQPFLEYLFAHRDERVFAMLFRPIPKMSYRFINWNLGLLIKGDTLMASKWIVQTQAGFDGQTPGGLSLVPNLVKTSESGNSFELGIAFPRRTSEGYEWNTRDVDGLYIPPEASVSAANTVRAPE